ncbi:MAG: hypothetical protein ACLPYS_03870 [Vulcanimicrobiaceae bacterium]
MQNTPTANLPFQTTLRLRPEPAPRRFESETPPPAVSAARLRRLALLVF